MFEVMVESHFCSAHHLLHYEGKCENQHGHNFRVKAWAKGEELEKSNILIDYKHLKAALRAICNDLDHIDLNEHPDIVGESPSSEFLARYIYHRIRKEIPQIFKVCVYETPTACAFYYE
jgi:6-pyruvoyltetrahydropterin/6-carboxytetrahydropterin synthase